MKERSDVLVVCDMRVTAIEVPDAFEGDTLAEIGLKAIDAHLQQPGKMSLVPLGRLRVREVDDRHAGLPAVRLPRRAVRTLEEVPLLVSLGEDTGLLSDVRVDPNTRFESSVVQPLKEALRVGEVLLVEFEVAPLVTLHPETVEVEDGKRNITL
jgi:hypothetical protein